MAILLSLIIFFGIILLISTVWLILSFETNYTIKKK